MTLPSDETPIRNAATTILWRTDKNGPRVLMGQRGAGAAFMPSKFVFPGGAVDQGDSLDPVPLGAQCVDRLCLSSELPPEKLAAAALRELREETGLLLAPVQQPPSLRFIFRAITPPGRPRRFDARFFLAQATALESDPDDFSKAEPELSHLAWLSLPQARALDLPFITEVVLAEVDAILSGSPDLGVPFFDNSSNTPTFRRLI